MVHGIDGKDAFRYLNALNTKKTTVKPSETANVDKKQPIKLTSDVDKIERQDLDKLSPYAGMGVSFSSKVSQGTPAQYAQAAPEFGSWQGNYTITNTKEANYDLADLRARLNPTQFAAEYVNPQEVAANIKDKNSPYAELFA